MSETELLIRRGSLKYKQLMRAWMFPGLTPDFPWINPFAAGGGAGLPGSFCEKAVGKGSAPQTESGSSAFQRWSH